MTARTITIDPANVDDNNIADDLTTGTDWSLTGDAEWLASTHPDSLAHRLVITTAADEPGGNAPTLTLTGTDADDNAITDSVVLPNATTVESVKYFKTVTSGTTGANATTGTFDIGFVDEVATEFFPLTFRENVGAGIFDVDITGTADISVQFATADPARFSNSIVPVNTPAALAAQTASVFSGITTPGYFAFRIVFNSYTDTAEVTAYTSQP